MRKVLFDMGVVATACTVTCHDLRAEDQPTFYERFMEGRYFYQEESEEEEKEREETKRIEDLIALQRFRQKFDEALGRAVVNPSRENLKRFIVLQARAIRKAETFQHLLSLIALSDPEFTGLPDNPVSEYGIEAKERLEVLEENRLLEKAKQRCALLFFFSGHNPLIAREAFNMIREFEKNTRWKVYPVSVDGVGLPEMTDVRFATGKTHAPRPDHTPAFVIMDTETKELLPAGFGLITVSSLKKNIALALRNANPDRREPE
ncbi:MAG: conjugal transfer protein TraF [Simkaniaceae bacterium]|nr:conjugal transfer protein TraF [Simkaniaceae bacterium]